MADVARANPWQVTSSTSSKSKSRRALARRLAMPGPGRQPCGFCRSCPVDCDGELPMVSYHQWLGGCYILGPALIAYLVIAVEASTCPGTESKGEREQANQARHDKTSHTAGRIVCAAWGQDATSRHTGGRSCEGYALQHVACHRPHVQNDGPCKVCKCQDAG